MVHCVYFMVYNCDNCQNSEVGNTLVVIVSSIIIVIV